MDYKPLETLLPIEVLMLINRWVKLKQRFYYDDLDILYNLKYAKIKEWLSLNEISPTRVIKRLSPLTAKMQDEINREGKNIEFLNTPENFLSNEFDKFKDLVNGEFEINSLVINLATYTLGTIPEVEELIVWAKNLIKDDFPEDLAEIDEDFVDEVLESAELDLHLETTRSIVIETFQDIIDGKYPTARDVWNHLIPWNVEYEEIIGMKSYYNRQVCKYQYGDFNNWHQTNLSPTWYWLVEFQSNIVSDAVFHVPYDLVIPKIGISFDSLPKVDGNQESFGRKISNEEAELYPIENLVECFGLSLEDFPHELAIYQKESMRLYYEIFGDDDYGDEDEFDFDDEDL